MNGVELLRLRNKMKLSRQQMAEAIGCSVGALRNWELGYYDVPKYIALACTAYVMNLPPYGVKINDRQQVNS